jgi:hypothetical protein
LRAYRIGRDSGKPSFVNRVIPVVKASFEFFDHTASEIHQFALTQTP